jgi:serine protease Do
MMCLNLRLGMNVVGVGMPRHFIVRHNPQSGKPQMLDVFNNAELLDRTAAAWMVMSITGMTLEDEHLEPSSKHDIIIRMLHNLLGNAKIEDDELRAARYLETIVAITNAK